MRLADAFLTDGMGSPGADIPVSRSIRADGKLFARFAAYGTRTGVADLYEAGGYRLKFPKGPLCEGVIVNTGGGMVGGDQLDIRIDMEPDAQLVLSTQSAEKIYRAEQDAVRVNIDATLGERAELAWLPQETLLFSGAKLHRRFQVDMAENATLTLFEGVIFGRGAMGERLGDGLFKDSWRIRRGNKLVFADETKLDGIMADRIDRRAIGNGARAIATFLHLSPDAEARLDEARNALQSASCECGASAWNKMLIARFAAADPAIVRQSAIQFLTRFRGASVPRVWQC
jgi:urease accessory protein